MKRRVLSVFFLLTVYAAAGWTQSLYSGAILAAPKNRPNEPLEKGKQLFIQGRTLFFSGRGNLDEAVKILTASKEFLAKSGDDFENYYWRGEAEFVLAEISEVKKDNRKAAQSFSESGKLAEKALTYDNNSSDCNRLVADTYMRLIPISPSEKGMVFKITVKL